MDIREDGFYGRQSVDRKDSISIESQLEFCQHELNGENYRTYTDKGYSGKNTDRPKFQELIRDIEQGLIKKVVVYKLDRISRSIIDFAQSMEIFQQHNVEFVSATEKFDTSTPMGRAMLHICIVFAQLERETIQRRVQDAYHSRYKRGFHMSGTAPFGYKLKPTVVEGIKTKMMCENPDTSRQLKLMFDLYSDPSTSLGDVSRYFTKHGIETPGIKVTRGQLAETFRNPIYVKADLDIYEFFKSQGAEIVNDAADFVGTNGCYFYTGRDSTETKKVTIKGHTLVMAPHEGLVSSDIWLSCRKKLLNNSGFTTNHKAKNTWLSGKVKCGKCNTGLMFCGSKDVGYFRCRKRADSKSCEGCGTIKVREFEQSIYREMVKKLQEFQTITRGKHIKINPKLTVLEVELAQVDTEIEKLLSNLTGANSVLVSYANSKIEELDTKRQSLVKAIADLKASILSPEHIQSLSGYLENWDNVSFEDKRFVLDGLVSRINATSESVQIEWKF